MILLRISQQRVWKWSKECETTFQQLKEWLLSDQVLVHYDSALLIPLACDASQYGVGVCITCDARWHRMSHCLWLKNTK